MERKKKVKDREKKRRERNGNPLLCFDAMANLLRTQQCDQASESPHPSLPCPALPFLIPMAQPRLGR